MDPRTGMNLDAVRRTGAALADHGTDLAAERRRVEGADVGRPWGADRLGEPFGTAYHGARDAALTLLDALAAGVSGAGRDLAAAAGRTGSADAESAAAFPRVR
jgi:hypothetical protein